MTAPRRTDGCPRRDEVVGLFLDGDASGLTQAGRDELAEHRDACGDCREALERARRLDALVAREARVEPDAGVVDRYLARALAGAAAPPETATGSSSAVPGRRRLRRRVAAVACAVGLVIAAGVAVGRRSRPEPGHAQVRGTPVRGTATERGVAEDTAAPRAGSPSAPPADTAFRPHPGTSAGILLPDGPIRSLGRRATVRPALADLAGLAGAGWVELAVLPGVLLRDGGAARWETVARDAERLRAAAADTLAGSGDGRRLLADLVAVLPDDRRLATCAAAARGSAAMSAALAHELRDGSTRALRVAARIGGDRVDRALVGWVGGTAERAFRLAEELRSVAERSGRARVLLEVWRDVDVRGGADDAVCAERLFQGLGVADVAAVCEVLAASRHAAQRARCLRALGAMRAPGAIDALWPLLVGARHDEALLAAFALGRTPRGGDDLAGRRPPASARAVWLAALAARGDPRAHGAIDGLAVSAEERAFLREGGFSPQQIEIAARLFRDRDGRTN